MSSEWGWSSGRLCYMLRNAGARNMNPFAGVPFFYFCANVFRADLLILGLGASMYPLSPETKRHINSLGIRVEVQDTRNAAAQFNLLATERGVTEIAAALIPIGYGYKGRS